MKRPVLKIAYFMQKLIRAERKTATFLTEGWRRWYSGEWSKVGERLKGIF